MTSQSRSCGRLSFTERTLRLVEVFGYACGDLFAHEHGEPSSSRFLLANGTCKSVGPFNRQRLPVPSCQPSSGDGAQPLLEDCPARSQPTAARSKQRRFLPQRLFTARGIRSALELDKTDVAILRAVQEDARRSLRDIAKKVGVSVPTVSARLATLEQLGVVKAYRAVLDPERLNERSVTLVLKASLQAAEQVAADLAKLEWVRRVMTARSGWIVVDATVTNREDVDTLLDSVGGIPNVVDCEHYIGVKTVKDEPRALVTDTLTASLICFQCKGPIKGEPIKIKMDERDHYLCCHSCERLYIERYQKMRAGA